MNLSAQRSTASRWSAGWQGVIDPLGETPERHRCADSQQYKRVAKLTARRVGDQPRTRAISVHTPWVTAYKDERADLSSVGGSASRLISDSAIQEYDLQTGKPLKTWDALDHIPLARLLRRSGVADDRRGRLPRRTRSNSVGGGKYLVSMRNTWAAYQMHQDRQRRSRHWSASSRASSSRRAPRSSGSTTCSCTRATWSACSTTLAAHRRRSAAERSHTRAGAEAQHHGQDGHAGGPVHARQEVKRRVPGQHRLLPNGNVAIGWGSQPFFSELSNTGKVLLDVAFLNPDANYRTDVQRIRRALARAQRRRLKGNHGAPVFANWNGATQLAAWRALALNDQSILQWSSPARTSPDPKPRSS